MFPIEYNAVVWQIMDFLCEIVECQKQVIGVVKKLNPESFATGVKALHKLSQSKKLSALRSEICAKSGGRRAGNNFIAE